MRRFQTVRGMRDYLPSDARKLRHVEQYAREIAELYGFEEVITPLVEHHDLLAKSGEEIERRMYAFNDLGGRKVGLRPEFTASVARLTATTLRNEPKPLRLFSTGTLYRYDEPQFGRYREFWQSNFEIVGSELPGADVETLFLTSDLMQKLGLRNCMFKIGHVGILKGLLSDEGLKTHQQNVIMQLLDSKHWSKALETAKTNSVSNRGLTTLKEVIKAKGQDTSRVLHDVKKKLGEYPSSVKALENLREIIDLSGESGAGLDLTIETGFARGLEYYTGMIFEVLVPEMEISLGGGGRYDKLVELFGGVPTPAVGVAHGLDRITLALDKQKATLDFARHCVALIAVDAETFPYAVEIASKLRKKGITVKMEVMGRAVSRALQDADRREASYAVIVGPKEKRKGKVTLRDMKTRQQHLVDIADLLKKLSAGP